nr:MAG TPA: hypothetical protein [Caudoviricetes sp.]
MRLNSKAVTGKIPQFYSNIDKINGASIIVATERSDGTLPKKNRRKQVHDNYRC